MAKHADNYGDDKRGRTVANLRAMSADVAATRDRLAEYLAIAKAPRSPVDPNSLRRGREDAAAGRVEDGRALMERIRAGEDF